MRNLTSPQAILLGLIALAIVSIPYSSNLIPPVLANSDKVQKVTLCNSTGSDCGYGYTQYARQR
ncbi:MAG: hypothetical protein VX237_09590 [Chloroflexota bacterium]|nr:hypothetical protein [Chloroflexota bacterium]